MKHVGQTRRAIAYDRRGFGATTFVSEPHSALDDLVAVLDALNVDRCVVAGCSNGGQIAFEMALRLAERVLKLVLVDSAPPGGPVIEPSPAVARLFAAIDAAEAAGDAALLNELEAQLWLDGPDAPAGRVSGPTRALFLEMNGRALASADVGAAEPMTGRWDQLPELTMPTLVVVGAQDLPSIVERARHVASIVPNAELVTIADAAHLPMLDQPAKFVECLNAFLSSADNR